MVTGHVLEAFLSGDWSSLISAGLGSLSDGAKKAFDDFLNKFNPSKEFKDDYKKWFKDQFDQWMPDPDEFHRIEDDINRLLKDVENEAKDVFGPISQTIENAVGSGQIPTQTDGGLGQTHEDFTPQGDVPFNIGTMPGMGTDAVGTRGAPMEATEDRAATADRAAVMDQARDRAEPRRWAALAAAQVPATAPSHPRPRI
jgi:hypothetical protein